MMTPGFQLMSRQNPANGRSGDVLHEPVRDELPRQFGAIPLGEATAEQIGAFAGQAHHVDRDLRGENRPWRRGQGRQRGHPAAGPETVWPTSARPCVGHRRPWATWDCEYPLGQQEHHAPPAYQPGGHGGRPLPAFQGLLFLQGEDNNQ